MSDRIGQQLGNYRLTQLLGQGGFADVYLGEHLYLNTKAAIKVLQTRLSNEAMADFQNTERLRLPLRLRFNGLVDLPEVAFRIGKVRSA